jgi:hypothetical protein
MTFSLDAEEYEYLNHAQREVLPKMESSALCISIASEKPNAKQCLEIGAAVLMDKPIILLVPEGRQISANLKRCASVIVIGNPSDAGVQRALQSAITSVLKNDRRTKR